MHYTTPTPRQPPLPPTPRTSTDTPTPHAPLPTVATENKSSYVSEIIDKHGQNPLFNTYRLVEHLKDRGMTDEQAVGVMEALIIVSGRGGRREGGVWLLLWVNVISFFSLFEYFPAL